MVSEGAAMAHDVLLVGGGAAGLRAAIAIAETNPHLSVAVVSKVYPMAEPFGQAATQAPHPMQVAASNARSASLLPTGVACASGAVPVGAEMYPPAWMMRSKELRSVTRSLITGNESARQGSTTIVSPFLYSRMIRLPSTSDILFSSEGGISL